MNVEFAVRGGRLTKWKGKIVSIAPGVFAIAVGVQGTPVLAYEADYLLSGGAGYTISGTSQTLTPVNQSATADLQAIIDASAITKTTTNSTSSTAADVTKNTVVASVISNTTTQLVDLSQNAGSGAVSNTILAAAMKNVQNDAFAAISSTSITNTAGIGSPTAVDLSDNTLATSVTLNTASMTLQGDLATGFANTDAGAMTVSATENGMTAGLAISTTQVTNDVQNATADTGSSTAFSSIAGSEIQLSITDAAADGNSTSAISVDGNTLSAAFLGNKVSNGINVQSDGMPVLSSAAGISSLQTADGVGISALTASTAATLTSASIDSTSGVDVSVAGAVTNTSLNVTSNELAATAAENTARNTILIDSGVSVDGPSTFGSLDTDLASTGTTMGAADLFASNVQKVTDSNISTKVDGTDGIAITAGAAMSGASLQATDNAITADTKGNTAANSITLADANSLSAIVTTTNVQTFADSTASGDGFVGQATALVSNTTLTLGAATVTGAAVDDTTIALSNNDVTTSAKANTATQSLILLGNQLASGQASTDGLVPTASLDASPGTLSLASGFSTANLQITTGQTDTSTPVVTSQVTGDGSSVGLTVGSTTSILSQSTLAVNGNLQSAAGVANEGIQSILIDGNELNSSVAMASTQVLTGGVTASTTASGLSLVTNGASATDLVQTADGNIATAGATGNLAQNVAEVSANLLTVQNSAVEAAATDTRDVLDSTAQSSGGLTGTAAISLLNDQRSAVGTTTVISSAVENNSVSNTLTVTGATSSLDLSADDNGVTSMARANSATNLLSVDLGSVDMTKAFYESTTPTSGAGGTGLVALGSAQFNSNAVTSTVDVAGTGTTDITAKIAGTTGTVDGATISATSNAMTSLASGNSVSNTFELTATNLVTLDSAAVTPTLALDAKDTTATTLSADNTAIAVGNEQINTGAITSTVGSGTGSGTNLIDASIVGTGAITDSTVAADGNQVLAQAVAASGSTNTVTVDAATLATSALVGSVQSNTGALIATVGDADSALKIQATMDSGASASASTVSASNNLVGSTATALTDVTSLELGGAGTASLGGTKLSGTLKTSIDANSADIAADYGVAQSQINSASAAATTTNVTISAVAGTFTNGAVDNSGNVVLAQTNGVLGETSLSATAAMLAATDSTNGSAPVMGLASTQTNSGTLSATLADAEVSTTVAGLGATTNSEALTMDGNALLASTSGVVGLNTLDATATSSADGTLGTSASSSLTAASGGSASADRMLVTDQRNTGTVTTTVNGTPTLSMDVTNAAAGATLAMTSNAIQGLASGVQGTNLLTSAAGANNATSSAIVAVQEGTAAVGATVTDADIAMSAASASATNMTMDANSVLAQATGGNLTNQLDSSAGASADGAIKMSAASAAQGTLTADLMVAASQSSSGAVSAKVDASPTMALEVTGLAQDTNLAMTSNRLQGVATGLQGVNVISNDAGTENSMSAALAAAQTTSATVTATVTAPTMTLTAGSATDSQLAMDGNIQSATAKGATLTNQLVTSGNALEPVSDGSALTTTSSTSVTGASSALMATQTISAAVTAELGDTGTNGADGQPLMKLTSGAVSGSTLSVDGNLFSATSTLGEASNTLAELSDTSIDHAAGSGGISLVSLQSGTANSGATIDGVSAKISATSTVAGSSLSLDRNSVTAMATGLTSANLAELSAGTSLTGAAGDLDVTSDAATIKAASSLLNSQTLTADVTSTVDPSSANGNGVKLAVTDATTGNSLLSVASNTLRAQSVGTSATNTALTDAGSITDATTGLTNDQSVTGSISSTMSEPAFGLTATAVTGTVDVSGNWAIASSTATTAKNSLALTSDTLIDGSSAGTITLKTDATADIASGGAPVAALANRQVSSGTTSATLNNPSGTDPVLASLSGAMTGSIAVDSNVLVAQSRGNYAENALSMSAGSTVDAGTQAFMASNQNRSGTITANVTGDTAATTQLGAKVDSLSGSMSVDNNLIRASGSANTAINTMTVSAASFNVGPADEIGSIPSTPSVTTNANFAVLNGQENTASVSSAVTNYGLTAASTAGVTGSTSLNGNMVMADATGNSSITTLRMAAAGTGGVMPAAAVSSQTNGGDMSAKVSGATFSASGASTSGDTSVSGNTIAATSTGNLSTTSVTGQSSVFTSF